MNKDYLKRGYYFPQNLLVAWERFHEPSKDFSPSAAGAFLLWMALGPTTRDRLRQAACSDDIDGQIEDTKESLLVELLDERVLEILADSEITAHDAAAISKLRQFLTSPEYRRRRQAAREAAEDEAAAARDAKAQRRKRRRRPKKAGA